MFVIVAGGGDPGRGRRRTPHRRGSRGAFDPFETHYITNTGDTDLVLRRSYWRDATRAAVAARRPVAGGSTSVRSSCSPRRPRPTATCTSATWPAPIFGADAYIRFQRMNGVRAWHLTGSDDYQNYVDAAGAKQGRTPPETAEHYSAEIARDPCGDGHRSPPVHRDQRRRSYPESAAAPSSRGWSAPTRSASPRPAHCSTARPASTCTRPVSPVAARRAARPPAATSARAARSRTPSPTWPTRSRRRPATTPRRGTVAPLRLSLHQLPDYVLTTTAGAASRRRCGTGRSGCWPAAASTCR